jgi:hypothetical protein
MRERQQALQLSFQKEGELGPVGSGQQWPIWHELVPPNDWGH